MALRSSGTDAQFLRNMQLMGSPQEVESGIQRIKEIFPVISISREYPNRNSADVRVYMEVIVSSGNELSRKNRVNN